MSVSQFYIQIWLPPTLYSRLPLQENLKTAKLKEISALGLSLSWYSVCLACRHWLLAPALHNPGNVEHLPILVPRIGGGIPNTHRHSQLSGGSHGI